MNASTVRRTLSRGVFCLLVLMIGCSQSEAPQTETDSSTKTEPGNTPNYPRGPIELKYYNDGPWAATSKVNFACCDSTGNAFDIWYPTELGKGGFQHPVITWGDGSAAKPTEYAYFLKHLASWGFIVIASETSNAHTGQEIIDAAKHVVAGNSDPSSIFYRKVAVNQVGAMGHSQGAGGAMNALMKSGGFIKTVVPFERPQQRQCTEAGDCPSTAGITSGSIFFVNGSEDGSVAPSTQSDNCMLNGQTNEQSYHCLYQNTPDTVDKAWGTVVGAAHNDIQGAPDCSNLPLPSQLLLCKRGSYGYLGYPTAWMMDQLQADAYAHSAFVSGSGEFFRPNPNWRNQISNIH
ncbi:poly(ethylene terephthalate) hydrolase family protein [Stenotrophobium rhamnosiphilum]|uniref:PET hydrolase/cutinase-like domain-containing protein n=1 Tax=Stenotrophobium rhamnosiphilum TaxID=2029166 RepID=A0A2T5MD89_9GAMM|nr:hypothetical protein [Stenotrophobium rhamnosiphilum]PTU30536.1 hypothetical protein CJD38_13580 [Stenotrophobium rhamnosiphilum]